jgi:hypothetical protein
MIPMSDHIITGLLLMATAIALFLGTTSNALPPVTFIPALILFVAGAVRFMESNHEAIDKNANTIASPDSDHIALGGTIKLEDQSFEFVVATDVSFPVEVQSGDALADQLRKLNQLLQQLRTF